MEFSILKNALAIVSRQQRTIIVHRATYYFPIVSFSLRIDTFRERHTPGRLEHKGSLCSSTLRSCLCFSRIYLFILALVRVSPTDLRYLLMKVSTGVRLTLWSVMIWAFFFCFLANRELIHSLLVQHSDYYHTSYPFMHPMFFLSTNVLKNFTGKFVIFELKPSSSRSQVVLL